MLLTKCSINTVEETRAPNAALANKKNLKFLFRQLMWCNKNIIQGVDPSRFEMALKMTNVQKLLISKTEECFEKDMQLAQKDQINDAMKTIVASRPGPEVSKQLMMSKNQIRCKNRQLKVRCCA